VIVRFLRSMNQAASSSWKRCGQRSSYQCARATLRGIRPRPSVQQTIPTSMRPDSRSKLLTRRLQWMRGVYGVRPPDHGKTHLDVKLLLSERREFLDSHGRSSLFYPCHRQPWLGFLDAMQSRVHAHRHQTIHIDGEEDWAMSR
jgi:hypothetical protein